MNKLSQEQLASLYEGTRQGYARKCRICGAEPNEKCVMPNGKPYNFRQIHFDRRFEHDDSEVFR